MNGNRTNFLFSHFSSLWKSNNQFQIEGLTVSGLNEIKAGFVYCRSTPNRKEIEAIKEKFGDCQVLMGDFNLGHRSKEDQEK